MRSAPEILEQEGSRRVALMHQAPDPNNQSSDTLEAHLRRGRGISELHEETLGELSQRNFSNVNNCLI